MRTFTVSYSHLPFGKTTPQSFFPAGDFVRDRLDTDDHDAERAAYRRAAAIRDTAERPTVRIRVTGEPMNQVGSDGRVLVKAPYDVYVAQRGEFRKGAKPPTLDELFANV